MPRGARAVIEGLPYHVTQRGNRRQQVFLTDDDRRRYLIWMRDYCGEIGVCPQFSANTTYTIQRWSTTETNSANQVKGTLTPTTDGSGNLEFPANWDDNGDPVAIGATVDYDWAYKIYRVIPQ